MDHEALRAVVEWRVEAVFALVLSLKEHDVEGGGQAEIGHIAVEPYDDGLEVVKVLELVDRLGFAQHNVDSAHSGPPAWARRILAVELVGVLDTAVVFFPELVLFGLRIGVPLLPEGFDEEVAVTVRFEPQEDVLFLGRDDVDDVLLEPFPVLQEVLGDFFSWRRSGTAAARRPGRARQGASLHASIIVSRGDGQSEPGAGFRRPVLSKWGRYLIFLSSASRAL
jgi:hypothetical protein